MSLSTVSEIIRELEDEIEKLTEQLYIAESPTYHTISITEDLKVGKQVSNLRFDRIYPKMLRKLSTTHWTPVNVAQVVTDLLVTKQGTKVLDVGSGCGKFCLIGAITKPDSQFFGIEQRSYLNEIARRASQSFDLKNVSFLDGNMLRLDWNQYDAFYFFNPFWENKMSPFTRIDLTVAVSENRFDMYVDTARTRLEKLKKGTRVVTYHGFGGNFPNGYECEASIPIGSGMIELWVKQ